MSTNTVVETLTWDDVAEGDELPPLDIAITTSVIVAGAIASRDFMPSHHDRDFAQAQGSQDIFMNILTTNGYVSRFLTDWAGPHTVIKRISIRLGAPNYPGDTMRFTGRVTSKSDHPDDPVIEIEFKGANQLGDHVVGTATLALPVSG